MNQVPSARTLAITTQPISTFAGTIPVGVEMHVVSWGEDGAANLVGLAGWPRVSMARWETFQLADDGQEYSCNQKITAQTGSHGAAEIEQPGESACRCDIAQAVLPGPFVSGEAPIPATTAIEAEAEHSPCSLGASRSVATDTSSVVPCLRGDAPEQNSPLEECPFDPTPADHSSVSNQAGLIDDINAELSAVAHREPAPAIHREERIQQARLKPYRLSVAACEVAPHVAAKLSEHGYTFAEKSVRYYDPEKMKNYVQKFTTEAQRHGDGRYRGRATSIDEVAQEDHSRDGADRNRLQRMGKVESTVSANRHGEQSIGAACGASLPCKDHEQGKLQTRMGTNDGVSSAEIDPSVPLCLRGGIEYPAPHLGMSIDERRGHRRVKTSDGQTVWRFGPGPGETLSEFTAWVNRLKIIFQY